MAKIISVFYLFEEKSMGRHRLTCLRTLFPLHYLSEIIKRDSASSDIDHCSDDCPHHIAQEPVS